MRIPHQLMGDENLQNSNYNVPLIGSISVSIADV